ncbi:MAG: glycosyltransferase [Comamonadaceae bacterium]|nr:glycosyltransferase [Comamonadaceae bacterium]
MRILIVIHQFFPEYASGTERVALNIARMAQRAGHHIRVLACTVDPEKSGGTVTDMPVKGALETVYQGLSVTFIPRSVLPATADISLDVDEDLVKSLADWMQQERFDVAHVMHTMRMGSAVLAAQRCGLPYVLTLTDFFLPCARINLVNLKNKPCAGPDKGRRCAQDCSTAPWTAPAYLGRFEQTQALLQAAGARIAPSQYVADRYREAFEGAEIQVIPHGVDLLALSAATVPPSGTDTPKAQLEIVFIGTIIPQKGLDILLKALALLPAAPVKLKVIGGFHGNSAYHDEVRSLAGTDARIEFTGALEAPEVFRVLSQAGLLCLPSRVPESFSLVLHESAVAGVPALVSDLGAPAQQVATHDCGQVVAAGNPKAWAAAISALIEKPDTLKAWKRNLFLPQRIEEEAFFYGSIYQRLRR